MLPDSPVHIVVPLQETTTIEGETVTLQCEVSKPDVDGVWFKDNLELAPDEKFEPILDGVIQALTIHDVELEDEAEYSIEVPGDSSTATLWVEGGYLLLTSSQLCGPLVILADVILNCKMTGT